MEKEKKQLTTNFTLNELIRSNTANKLNIDNTPSDEIIDSLKKLCTNVLQPIRDKYGKPMVITSGYRCKALNKAVGGVKTSQHVLGQAADINNGHTQNKALFELIKQMTNDGEITVGQLLWEHGGQWIHVSLPTKKHKNEIRNIN